jgi:hypothetical protein
MVAGSTNICAQCAAEIAEGQRWVREKVYELILDGREPRYHRYHAEFSDRQELSCWERHLLRTDSDRLAA